MSLLSRMDEEGSGAKPKDNKVIQAHAKIYKPLAGTRHIPASSRHIGLA